VAAAGCFVAMAEGQQPAAPATPPQTSSAVGSHTVLRAAGMDLRGSGVFGFPQRQAKVVCDRPDLRVSVWSNDRFVYFQAVLWQDNEVGFLTNAQGQVMTDRASLMLDLDANQIRTEGKDRHYSLGLGLTTQALSARLFVADRGTNLMETKGRGGIRYLEQAPGRLVRVDSFLIPLQELSLKPGDKLRFSYLGYSARPTRTANSLGDRGFGDDAWNSFHECVLGGPGTLDGGSVPDDRLGAAGVVVTAAPPIGEAFTTEIAALPAEKQLQRVMAKLKELNPRFDGREQHKIENAARDSAAGVPARPAGGPPRSGGLRAVTELSFSTVAITNIAPLAALKDLKKLSLAPWGGPEAKGALADLTPLAGLRLTGLWCQNTQVRDLGPLQGMPLTVLSCSHTPVADLAPLRGMPLTVLSCDNTQVSDLAPLAGMPLTVLWCNDAGVADLSPLSSVPLKELRCDFRADRDTGVLRGIRTLQKINDQNAAMFWMGGGALAAAGGVAPGDATPTLASLRGQGVFGFPQHEAKVICDNDHLRLSLWSNDRYLYAQAVLWKDDDSEPGQLPNGGETADRSALWIDADANRGATPRVDRWYELNMAADDPGLRAMICGSADGSYGLDRLSEARGAVRYLKVANAKTVRVDCYLIPLKELGCRRGDRIRFWFDARSPKPSFRVNGKGGVEPFEQSYRLIPMADYLDYVLGGGTSPLTSTKVPDDRRQR